MRSYCRKQQILPGAAMGLRIRTEAAGKGAPREGTPELHLKKKYAIFSYTQTDWQDDRGLLAGIRFLDHNICLTPKIHGNLCHQKSAMN